MAMRLESPCSHTQVRSTPITLWKAITAWEVGLKAARGELKLPMEAEEWFEGAIAHHRLQVFEITPRIAFEANRLPWHHRDPADRFILATARLHHMAVVTADDNFAVYGVETFV